MNTAMNPAAPHTLPWFITPPGGTDMLYNITTIVVITLVVLIGVFFFWLHTLPERMGHKKLQYEVVAVLGLLSLLTHQHIFWIIGLVLAVIDLPNIMSPLRRIAASTEKLAGITTVEEDEASHPAASHAEALQDDASRPGTLTATGSQV